MKNNLVLGLGSNLGNRMAHILHAIQCIEKIMNSDAITAHIYETPPWGNENQPRFLNTTISIETDYNIKECLTHILQIEKQMGRQRAEHWGPRIIDIDILFYNDVIYEDSDLIVPHKYLHERAFVLAPLNDILPNFVHPILKQPIQVLKHQTSDNPTLFSRNKNLI